MCNTDVKSSIITDSYLRNSEIEGCSLISNIVKGSFICYSELHNILVSKLSHIKFAHIAKANFGSKLIIPECTPIYGDRDYIIFKNWWSSDRIFVWFRQNNLWSVGCFTGTGDELINKAYKDSQLSGDMYKQVVEYVERNKELINKIANENV